MSNVMNVANSPILFLICLVPIAISLVQAALFLRKGLAQAKAIGISAAAQKKIISNSAIFSILPTLPILITLITLMPLLGKFIPWLRLSIIGNAVYETMAADMAIKSYGLTGLGDSNVTLPIFGTVVWAMSLGIMLSPILTTFFLKSYDKRIKKAQSASGFLPLAIASLFIGMLTLMAIPRLVNFTDPVGICTTLSAAVFVILLEFIAKKKKIKAISDFSFPAALVFGMITALMWTRIF